MTRYEYEAEKWNGEQVKGRIDAKSKVEAQIRVRNLGYKNININITCFIIAYLYNG